MIDRQKIVGWVLIAVSVAYVAYFVKVRVLAPGPLIERREWAQLIMTIVVFMIGTANVRLAAMRESRRRTRSSDDNQ